MNGFTDLHVVFGDSVTPARLRLGNPWLPQTDESDQIWIGAATSTASLPVATAGAPGWRLWASGPIFSYRGDPDRPLERFADDVATNTADPALLDAHAVVFGWCSVSRRLSVWTDRMGTVHAYAGGQPGRMAVGTFLPAVAERSSRALDWVGITGFCGFGFYPGDRTMYDDVRILRPATRTVFDERGVVVSQDRYWDWWHDPDHSRSDDDFLDEFHDIWTRTIRRQLAGTRSVVPLSGGLDSRTVFSASAPSDGIAADPVRTLTYGYSTSSPEIRISRRVAAARGHTPLELVVGPYLLDRLSEVLDAVEGFQGLSFSRQAGVSTQLAALGDHVVGGHWGDVWFDTAGAPAGGSPDLVSIAHQKFAKRGREWLFEHLCTPNLDEPPEQVLRQVLNEELTRIPDLGDPDMRLKALKTEQWSFRWTLASVRAYQLAVPTLLPFYANEVIDFFLRVPSDRLPARRLQTAYLRRHHLDLARITWQDTGMSLFERPWEPAFALTQRGIAKLLRAARRQQVVQRNWEVQYLADGRTDALGRPPADASESVAAPSHSTVSIVRELLSNPSAADGYAADALVTLAVTDAQLEQPIGRAATEFS